MIAKSDISTREELIHALMDAAVLEHSVICQYLFAAFSLKKTPDEGDVTWTQLEQVRSWQADILLVAREEMEHLGLVCNLLTAIGGSPYFRRPRFPHPSPYAPPDRRFTLERFSEVTMERFLYLERTHGVISAHDPDGMGEPLDERPRTATIGGLYRRIRNGFEHVHASNRMLFVGPRAAQVDNAALDLPDGWFDFNLRSVENIESALQAVDQIVEAGDGSPHHSDATHYQRFQNILTEFQELRARDPAFEPARPVAANPTVEEAPDIEPEHTTITHPHTRLAVRLYDTAYDTMLLMLIRFYSSTDDTAEERAGLLRIAFFPMMTMVLRPLGELLTLMPAQDDRSGHTGEGTYEAQSGEHGKAAQTAGASYMSYGDMLMHPDRLSAWTFLHERLQTMESVCGDLHGEVRLVDAPWARRVHSRLEFLHENLARLAHNLEEYVDLPTARTKHLLRRLF